MLQIDIATTRTTDFTVFPPPMVPRSNCRQNHDQQQHVHGWRRERQPHDEFHVECAGDMVRVDNIDQNKNPPTSFAPSSKGHGHKRYSWQNSDMDMGMKGSLTVRTLRKVLLRINESHHILSFKTIPTCIACQQTTSSSPSCLRAVADTTLPSPYQR